MLTAASYLPTEVQNAIVEGVTELLTNPDVVCLNPESIIWSIRLGKRIGGELRGQVRGRIIMVCQDWRCSPDLVATVLKDLNLD